MPVRELVLLTLSGMLLVLSGWRYRRGQLPQAVVVLMAAALALRLGIAGLNPFLHDWDERFHALVAKNLLTDWTRPVLRATPVLVYDYRHWCCNSLWLHKPPLFLWQIAGSFWLFGVNELALRLPSAVMGALVIWPIYRLGCLVFSPAVGYYAGLLFALAYYPLELTSGWQSVDHADVAFLSYVTGSLWAYYEYRQAAAHPWRWALLTGLLAGAAVLCKWLPGLVVYAAWGVDIIVCTVRRRQGPQYAQLLAAAAVTLAVVLPWQLYIHHRFPLESAFEQEYAARHFGEVLEDKSGPWYFYLTNLWYQYQWMVLLIAGGLGLLFTPAIWQRPLRPLLIAAGAIFGFFSLAATKMVSYTYVVAPILLLLAALAWTEAAQWLKRSSRAWHLSGALLAALVLYLNLRPTSLLKHHTAYTTPALQKDRQRKLQHTAVYRQLDALVPAGYLVLNAPPFEDIEAMFYSQRNVYWERPNEPEYRELRGQGIRVAVLTGPGTAALPAYLQGPEVLVVPVPLD
ncbi:ArnT family glycosyltransferase [Hymenobacter negativus]|uniref:Glycosyltransferase family 39 protein n=1 Tax=Hymenobacter negativus TaxID=2795026 RepID=A0ABS3QP44_9BACT|nr:glycosyltransferase family 39 protein [Hymenobacter negativus]MBO2013055.1 glycosyltransferase family 39 protein [Hymenobacter negativus]